MKTASTSVLLALALLPLAADAHGYMTKPPSRSDLAHETYVPENPEFCPHCVASVGQVSDCAGCGGRGYPGVNPWSAPATSVDKDTGVKATLQEKPHVTNERGDPAVMGVCGVAFTANLDYNKPNSRYGLGPVEEYAPGEEITVEWCVNADHGGIPMFRLCDDQALVDLLLDSTRTPTAQEYEELEACFERGNIRCDSVDGNDCRMVDDCYASGARDWEACQEGAYFHCRSALGQTDRRYRCQNTYDSCEHGSLARYRLKIPESTKPSAHTILNFRWDTFENNEAFMGCADIKITGDPAPAPAPAPAPVSTPTPKPVSPTAKPQADDGSNEGYCCFWPQSADRCGQCVSPAEAGNWCAKGRKECVEDCGHVWCDDGAGDAPVAEPTAKPVPSPTAKPVPSPTPKPVSPTAKPVAPPTATCDDVQQQVAVLQSQIDELLSQPCGDDACDVELYAVEGDDVYDSMGVRRDCCPGLEPTLEDRDPTDPLIGTWPQIIVCREPSARRNLRGDAKA